MVTETHPPSPERVAIMQWTARIGAVTAEALALRLGTTVASARGRLGAAAGDGLLARRRPLAGQPALYTPTRAGLRLAGLPGLGCCRVSPSNAQHLIACVGVAAALERCYPDHRVLGERELRHDGRERAIARASAPLGLASDGSPRVHVPDLVLWRELSGQLPVAVEVELTVKAPRRLAEICRAWARCRGVAGVLYLAAPEVARALHRAIERAHAGERIVVVPLDALARLSEGRAGRGPRNVPSDA